MTADRPTTEPRTEAGRDMLYLWTQHDNPMADEVRQRILAIEAEAAQGAAPLTWDGVFRCEDHPAGTHTTIEEAEACIQSGEYHTEAFGPSPDTRHLSRGAAPLTRDDRTNASLPPSAPDEVVRWMRNNDLVAVTRRAYDDVRWGAAPRAEGLPSVEALAAFAEILRKLIRQYHGVAHSHLGRASRGGSWLSCDDRWCSDIREVLGESVSRPSDERDPESEESDDR